MVEVINPEALRERIPHYWRKSERAERLWFILYLITERMGFLDSEIGFVRLNRKRLQQWIGWESAQWVPGVLRDAGFIEPDGSWQKGRKSQGWRLTAWAAAAPRERRPVTEPCWERYLESEKARLFATLKSHPAHVILWDSLHQLSIHPSASKEEPSFDGDEGAFRRRCFHWDRSAQRIANDEWRFFSDSKTGRIFNNLTSLPKVLRPYVCLCGDPCVEIDVGCSQPFLLASLYPTDSKEKSRYLEVVCNGNFYETVGAASGIDWAADGRSWLKEQIYAQVLYGPVRRFFPLWEGFRRLFPELGALIAEAKKGDHAKLAIAMQKAEASIMVRGVVPELEAMFPALPILTVHDSLVVPVEYSRIAEEAIRRRFRMAIGCDPSLRTTQPAPTIT
jgi:hypothetical protein